MMEDLLQDLPCLLKNHIDLRELFSRVLIHQHLPVDLDHQGGNPSILPEKFQGNYSAGEWGIDTDSFESLTETIKRS